MRTHPFLIINPRSGDDEPSAEQVAAAARRLDVEVHVLRTGDDPAEVARRSGAAVLGAAGGDGSLGTIASVAVETDAAFVCVPFGTRNHFARDVGLDRDDPLGALRAFAGDAVERRIDVARVVAGSVGGKAAGARPRTSPPAAAGDRIFLNNLSLGVYAGLVHRRERHRRRGEALARVRALAAVARRRHAVHASVNGEQVRARVLLVGNNRYEISLFTVGERERLDRGELQLWVAAGWLPTAWDERVAPAFEIELPGAPVRAALDGEPVLLEPPLRVESLPGALRLRLPKGDEMHDNPEPTEEEQELAQTDRQDEEESMRYPSEGNPETPDDAAE